MENNTIQHVPVMLNEALEGLNIVKGNWYIDATFGRGGHTQAILEKGGNVIACDHDAEAVEYGKEKFAQAIKDGRLIIEYINFDIISTLPSLAGKTVAGALFDFGVSSNQLNSSVRGFTFQQNAPLDMRMDIRLGVTAKDLVNALSKKELYKLLTIYAQEFQARRIAEAIVDARANKPIETTQELSLLIEKAVGGRAKGAAGHIHPATKTFMALRMAVNDELGNIERALPTTLDILAPSGRIVTISFHEGEDRMMKHMMQAWEAQGKGVQVTKRPLEATSEEVRRNPRSRSAKMRIFEKTAGKTEEGTAAGKIAATSTIQEKKGV